MDSTAVLIVLLVVLAFAGMIILAISSSRKEKENKAQLAQRLGLTPVPQPDAALTEQVAALHRTPWSTSRFELRNVSRRRLPDGELFLFDLVDTGGDANSLAANQAVAIRSNSLRLPPFQFFPKADAGKYALGGLANKMIEWGVSKVGTPVRFPQFPAFEARYSVTSSDPAAVQQFFDERLARYFARTEYYTLRAAGDLFVFAELEPGARLTDPAQTTQRMNRALETYHLSRKA